MILVIDCCPSRDNSATRKFYKSYLDTLDNKDDVKVLYLEQENLKPYTLEDVSLREQNLADGNMDWEGFKYANDFKNADEIIVAAPYWDLSFPSLLIVYIEHIMVPGITFGYEGIKAIGYSKRII